MCAQSFLISNLSFVVLVTDPEAKGARSQAEITSWWFRSAASQFSCVQPLLDGMRLPSCDPCPDCPEPCSPSATQQRCCELWLSQTGTLATSSASCSAAGREGAGVQASSPANSKPAGKELKKPGCPPEKSTRKNDQTESCLQCFSTVTPVF